LSEEIVIGAGTLRMDGAVVSATVKETLAVEVFPAVSLTVTVIG
jgi:hypothetical protein